MSHPSALRPTGDFLRSSKAGASREQIVAELQRIKYKNKDSRYSGAKGGAAAAPPVYDDAVGDALRQPLVRSAAAQKNGVEHSDGDIAILKAVQKALEGRMQDAATSYDDLLSESKSLQSTAVFTFTWRKQPTDKEVSVKKSAAERAGKVYEADNTPTAPEPVSFSVPTLNRMFGGKIDFSKDQYLLSAHIESAHSTAPYPLDFTLHGVQGQAIEREFSSDGTAATLTLLPNTTWTGDLEIFRLRDVNVKNLYKHGNADMKSELEALVPLDDSSIMLVPPNRTLGKILKRNQKRLLKGGELELIPVINMYAVDESLIVKVLEDFNDQVMNDLKTTAFPDIQGTLARADRTISEADRSEFANAEDAAGIGSAAALEAAHKAKHQVTVKVRLHVIDPSKLADHEVAKAARAVE